DTFMRIRDNVRQPLILEGEEIRPDLVAGIFLGDTSLEGGDEAVHAATIALNTADETAAKSYEIYDTDMRSRVVSRLKLETDLRSALQKNEFVLHYQPIYQLDTGRLFGFEALLRWFSQSRGTVGPDQFIPVAESTGDIVPIGRWVLDSGIRQIVSWNKHFPEREPIVVNVNVSGKQVVSPSFIQNVTDFLANNALTPNQLKLEITETAVMDDEATVIDVMNSRRKACACASCRAGSGNPYRAHPCSRARTYLR
ncbi:MAG: EAL domain-containing protein, partial [Alphaproteobacteria bacterium]|nr:EAL domain-containing protein [Alphaproteobacteria bacterium]